ncbi:hypothetical protein [Lederbergia citrea]|uniref:Uncharacterized protein n=1 Tax=Lederbergia citrea TaxID=2833581 RepID=A0A942Z557_9BACI|nr:hypothetical protein [Lederbergia citrea]MBS4176231.1 hypothetical protein [Lederbergia citrea]MBS4202791.1 hypothetical protein [Lederbergia citrea]MBS4222541.1 hypothetical protein [Lederbergia citrea]
MRANEQNRMASYSSVDYINFKNSAVKENYSIQGDSTAEYGFALSDIPSLKQQLERS